jgi:isopenicillin N synthase-like dioxygenase
VTAFPLIDIAPWLDGSDRASVARAVDEALCTSGFLLITGHGVPDNATEHADRDRAAARSAARTVFALPPEHKARYAVAVGGHGYLGPGTEANAAAEGVAGPPDLKESWTVGADAPTGDPALDATWFAPNVWPAEVPALQTTLEQHMRRMCALADTLLEIGAAGLGLDADHFTRHTRHPSYTLNVNRYPPLTEVGPPAPDQFRIGAHTDFGTFTVLDREPGVGRVLPPQAFAPDEDLVSLVFFYELDPDTVVESLGPPVGIEAAPPVRAADYLADKLAITVAS